VGVVVDVVVVGTGVIVGGAGVVVVVRVMCCSGRLRKPANPARPNRPSQPRFGPRSLSWVVVVVVVVAEFVAPPEEA